MKNGQLWFNINTNRIERVVGQLNKLRVFTVGHGYSNLKVVKKTMLVKANLSQRFASCHHSQRFQDCKGCN